jgi:hypothetical protein
MTWCGFESTFFRFETQHVVSILLPIFFIPPPSFSCLFTKSIIHNCHFWSTTKHYTTVCATSGAAAMPGNHDNAPDNAVVALVHDGDGAPTSISASAPLFGVSLVDKYNNPAAVSSALTAVAATMVQAPNASVDAADVAVAAQALVAATPTLEIVNIFFSAVPPPASLETG